MSDYTGWNAPLLVTLTRTSNPYLVTRLPVRGLLRVLEMRIDGFAQPQKVSFQEVDAEGRTIGTTVMVDDAEFTYALPQGWKEHHQERLREEIVQAQPNFFTPGLPRKRELDDLWALPGDRVLFSCIEEEPYEPDPVAGLYVLDRRRQRIKRIGDVSSPEARRAVADRAAEWMRGLRDEDLSAYDADMIDWLCEMAYRMSADQLTAFQEAYFAIPPDAWGTPDNPAHGPTQRLGHLLSSMGFSDDYIDMHW